MGVPYFALNEPVGRAIRRRNLIEDITGIALIARLVKIDTYGDATRFVPDVVAVRETPHTAAYTQISRAEAAGMIAPGSAHTSMSEILNGVFDGTTDNQRFLPEDQSIKHVLEALGVEPLA